MILGQISYLDCLAFLVLLIPQLLLRTKWLQLIEVAVRALPFLRTWHELRCLEYARDIDSTMVVIQLPYQFLHDHLLLSKARRPPFVQQATLFEDFVIRIVRYAFAKMPASIGIVHAIDPDG